MQRVIRLTLLFSALLALPAAAAAPPQLEVAPVLGVQFFRGFGTPGLGLEQSLQNNVVVGARSGALFGERLRLELGLELTPTVVVGRDRLTYVLQPHLDASIDLATGWLRPYIGVGVGFIGFVDNEWIGGAFASIAGESNPGPNPDVEFAAAALTGLRLYPGELASFFDNTVVRLDVRDVIYAARNGYVNYMMDAPGSLTHFHNLQVSLAFAFQFDAYSGEVKSVPAGAVPDHGINPEMTDDPSNMKDRQRKAAP